MFFGVLPFGCIGVRHLKLINSATGQADSGRIIQAESTDPKHALASIVGGGKMLRVAFRAVGVHGQISGRFLVTVQHRGTQYLFREDYLGYVCGKEDANGNAGSR